MSFTLNGKSIELPPEVVQSVFLKAGEESVIARLSGQTPLTLSGATVPVYAGGVEAGVVAEGANAPVGDGAVALKHIVPQKVSVIVPVSKEMATANPGDLLTHINADIASAIGRALDTLILHGKDARTSAPVAGQVGVASTAKRVELVGSDYKAAILAGFGLVDADYDVNGAAFDTRSRANVLATVNEVQFGLPNLASQELLVAGVPSAFSRTVGKAAGTDTKIKGLVGDFEKIRWGFASNLELSQSTEATLTTETGTINLWQADMIGIKATATIGGVVLDTNAFAVIEDAA